ncbi:MAG: hypothetical protein ACXW20_20320, partial [Burkholderiales bacterium]
MRRRDFIASMGVVSVLPRAAWSHQSTCEGASDLACSGDIPLGYDDARFSGNAVSNALKLSPNGAVSNKSITETGSNASIGTGDGATIKTVGSIRESAFVAFIGSGVNFGLRVHPDTGGDN